MPRATSNNRHGSHRPGSATKIAASAREAGGGCVDRHAPRDAKRTASQHTGSQHTSSQRAAALNDFGVDRPLTIGEVAQQYGITLRTLRFYEAKRLLTPHRHGATRLYRPNDRKRLNMILTARRLGFTLAEIKHLLSKATGDALHLTREQCVKQIKLLEQQKRSIETAITELQEIHTAFYRRLLEEAGESTH
jgi:DNA-binding transcriptional MerR regulator